MATKKLWGRETEKAIANFPVSGERVPIAVIHWLARIKSDAARVNAALGVLDADRAARIADAADRVAGGDYDEHFPVDVFQTGSGTSTNMNVNEVIARLAGDDVHPNDHVNLGQSSNDVFPTAVHLACLERTSARLLPALAALEQSLAARAEAFADVIKAGRTHMMDALPVTLGQEFAGYAAQLRLGRDRIAGTLERVCQVPLGGTATGTGMGTHPEFAAAVRARLSQASGLAVAAPADRFEAQASRDSLVELSGALKGVAVSLTKIAGDLRLMASGPRAGFAEIELPALQKGSSMMPGKTNPVMIEVVCQVAAQVMGNDLATTLGGMQGQFELNVAVPLIARNLLQSIDLLSSACELFASTCVDGITANRARCQSLAEASLAIATALNPVIGYDKAGEIVRAALSSGRSVREVAIEMGVDPALLDRILDPRSMIGQSR